MVAEVRVTTPNPQRARAQPICDPSTDSSRHWPRRCARDAKADPGALQWVWHPTAVRRTTRGDPGEPVSLEASSPGR